MTNDMSGHQFLHILDFLALLINVLINLNLLEEIISNFDDDNKPDPDSFALNF